MLSWRIFYVIERIRDVLNLDTWVGCDDMKIGLERLERELKRMRMYVMYVEARDEEQFKTFLEISAIVDQADDILEGLPVYKTSTVKYSTTSEIEALLKRIELYTINSSVANFRVNSVTGNSQNHGGQQKTGSVTVNIYNNPNLQPLVSRVATRQSYGHIRNRDFVGFQLEIETLLDQVIKNTQTRVVGIVGMGGCGKTTLANHLYHHPAVNKHFAHRAWVCVSQVWNKRDILYEILRETEGAPKGQETTKNWSDAEFFEKVYDILSEKRYLVILDDIWTVHAWSEISKAFPSNEGSKVLVTSRNEVLPNLVDKAFFVLKPNLLDFKESYELFCTRTFTNGDRPTEYAKLGEEMVKKCKGLPLAITALSGILRVNMTICHWMEIREKFSLRISKAEDSTHGVVQEVLALSYYDLPYCLKPFFLYLSIFPEDYEIRVKSWMRLWIEECLILDDQSYEERMKPSATEILEELTQRFIVQNVKRNHMGQVKTFQVHDLIREMCVEKAQKEGFLNESHRVHLFHLPREFFNFVRRCDKLHQNITSLFQQNNLSRLQSTTMICERFPFGRIQLDFSNFKFLRALLIKGSLFFDQGNFPTAIENLIHLRYLGLSGAKYRLPQTIGSLQNLLVLDLSFSDCYSSYLPKDFWKMTRLEHLYLPDGYINIVPYQPLNMNELKNLQTLWKIRAGDWMLSEMARLSPTLRHLYIDDVETQQQLEAVFCCPSLTLGYLQSLKLAWRYPVRLWNMEAFKQCDKLHKLSLKGTIEKSLNRLTLVVPPNLTKLELKETQYEKTDLMALLGSCLPYLKALILEKDSYMGTKLTCKADSFPALEKLVFERLLYLKQWDVERGALPCLKDLTFICCVSLHKFPEDWRFVSNIQRVKYDLMTGSFMKSLRLWSAEPRNLNVLLDEGDEFPPPSELKYAGHEHDLVKAHRYRYYCNVCNQLGYHQSLCCEECDFDLCLKCAMNMPW